MSEKALKHMMVELKKAPNIYHPSNIWKEWSKIHMHQLSNGGLDNFKRSVNLRYFNWEVLGILRHQLFPIFLELKRGNFVPIVKAKFVNPKASVRHDVTYKNAFIYRSSLDFISAFVYKVYVAYLFDYVSRMDTLHILDTLEEPILGNPFLVRYKNKSLSQDLCNSVHEFYSIIKQVNPRKIMRITELGAGYGRLAYVFLKVLPKASYCIIDIPPTLYVAQEYLSKIFPKEKIFYFRPFALFKEVKKEFESAKIKFLMAHQIELLPDKYFDLTITISSLHEMTREQIQNYITHINRLTNGYFYTKQWQKSRIKDNLYISEEDYPVPQNWQHIYQHRHPIQNMFFEALYRIS